MLVGLAAIVVLGVLAQWLAWRLRLPSILLLLLFGFLAGRLGWVDPDLLFGDTLLPLVSLSVAILLFEGGLTLRIGEVFEHGRVVGRIVSIGAAVTWLLTTLLARLLLGFDWNVAALLGAILIVTGPTVVLPLLRQIRPTGAAGTILKWEAILIDPLGAVLAVLVYEGLAAQGAGAAVGGAIKGVLATILVGGGVGLVFARLLTLFLERFWIPDRLHSAAALAMVVGGFGVAHAFQHDAGLLTVTLMGVYLANQSRVSIRHILEFKENLRVLLISSLFILLSARLRPDDFFGLDAGAFLFLAALLLVVRPLAVVASTWGSGLERAEKAYLCCMAPRGIVAAAIASVIAARLDGANALAPVTFLVIVGTVAVYGLAAAPIAYRLGLAVPKPQGVLVLGAHSWGRALAEALAGSGLRVLLVDTNARNIATARMAGMAVHHGNLLTEEEEMDLAGLGRLFALTPNDEVNALATTHFAHLFGRREVYQLTPDGEESSTHLRGRYLPLGHAEMSRFFSAGARVKATGLTDRFGLDAWRKRYGPDAVPLATLGPDGEMVVCTVDHPLDPEPGQTLIGLVPPEPPEPKEPPREGGGRARSGSGS